MNVASSFIDDFRAGLLAGISRCDFGDTSALLSKLDSLQEQPQLIDPHLEHLISPVNGVLLESLKAEKLSQFRSDAFNIVYHYTKIRGPKVVVKFLPNDVHLLEPVIACLNAQPLADHSLWQARYVLLLWLSLISMAPFHLRTFDRSSTVHATDRIEIVDRLVPLAEGYLGASGREREAAGVLIARLVTRKDVNKTYVPEFLTRSMSIWKASDCTMNFRVGILSCMCEMFKIGNRDILLNHVDLGITTIKEMEGSRELRQNTLLRKFKVKLAQRIALTLLRPTGANWRYQNNPKSLSQEEQIVAEEEDTEDVPEVVEEIVGILLESLQDRDTVVRYSAAKGIGRITSRLPNPYAEEIVDAIAGLMESDASKVAGVLTLRDSAKDSSWHGSCLALAELCRSGALTPSSLRGLLPYIFLAIQFDIKKGSHSLGTSVRDAACYVMWSVLRCYRTDVLLPFTTQIATTLIVVAMFDREISVRRAASAAYQEGVGRHPDGVFPFGIAVLSKADFFAVGQRRVSFLEVAPDIYRYVAYRSAILDYLLDISCIHWDQEIREQAGQCLGKIVRSCEVSPREFGLAPLQLLTERLNRNRQSIDVNARHGAFYALGEVTNGLSGDLPGEKANSIDRHSHIGEIFKFGNEVPQYNFRGPQAALMYLSVTHYIKAVCQLDAGRCAPTEQVLNEAGESFVPLVIQASQHFKIATGGLAMSDQQTRTAAAEAIHSLFQYPIVPQTIERLITDDKGVEISNTRNPSVLKGWLEVFGKLNCVKHPDLFDSIIGVVFRSTRITGDATRDDPETRKIAITTLGMFMSQFLDTRITGEEQTKHTLLELMDILDRALSDYTIDSRGDVGSWVRESAVNTTCHMLELSQFWKQDNRKITDLALGLIAKVVAQCLGKIDNLRVATVRRLTQTISSITQGTESIIETRIIYRLLCALAPIFDSVNKSLDAGASPLSLFSSLSSLITFSYTELVDDPMQSDTPASPLSEISKAVILEYLICASAGSQSTITAASTSLIASLDSQPPHFLIGTLEHLQFLITSSASEPRVLVPLLSTLSDLLDAQVFFKIPDTRYDYCALFSAIQATTLGSPSLSKITASMRCYASLASLPHVGDAVRRKAWKKLGLSLGHRYPNVRVLSAELLYGVLSSLDVEGEEESEEVVECLVQNDWSLTPDRAKIDIVKAFAIP